MIHLVGDGLAGRMLARWMVGSELGFTQYGDGLTNTPPVGFVHLFQGRTFHRDPVELEAFERAVEFWRAEPLAREWEVERSVSPGDRLDKSADTETVPEQWRPARVAPELYRYSPGFTVHAAALAKAVPAEIVSRRVDPEDLRGPVIHATGLAIQKLLPGYRWDINPGRTVQGSGPKLPDRLYLKAGCHLGADPNGTSLTVGGRVNSKGQAKDDETELASQILGAPVSYLSQWWGERIANALDRWPLIGWLDDQNFVFAGFGGRALFWLPYCCDLAMEALRKGTNASIPERLRAGRFLELRDK